MKSMNNYFQGTNSTDHWNEQNQNIHGPQLELFNAPLSKIEVKILTKLECIKSWGKSFWVSAKRSSGKSQSRDVRDARLYISLGLVKRER